MYQDDLKCSKLALIGEIETLLRYKFFKKMPLTFLNNVMKQFFNKIY